MSFNTYNPKKIIVTLGEYLLSGFAEGTFVRVEYNADAFSMSAGAYGDTVRVQSHDRTGMVTLTLMQSSLSNDALDALAAQDESSGAGVRQLRITDQNGTTRVFGLNAWVKKKATAEYGTDASTREWVIDVAELDTIIGGHIV